MVDFRFGEKYIFIVNENTKLNLIVLILKVHRVNYLIVVHEKKICNHLM